jgi:hypothetical protein
VAAPPSLTDTVAVWWADDLAVAVGGFVEVEGA